MKKLIALLLIAVLAFTLAACGGKTPETTAPADDTPDDTTAAAAEQITDANGNVLPSNLPDGAFTSIRETFDNMEYSMYMSVFQDPSTKQFDGVEFTKVGTFAVLQDEWSGKTRYYVWGYADKTRCCDYQWEFVPEDVSKLPAPGSYVRVKGTFTYTEEQQSGALDHYWITNAKLEVLEEYTPQDYDYDLTTMSATLARVQLFSIQNYTEKFVGKTMLIYGRSFDPTTLQHPYYDETWTLKYETEEEKTPAKGDYLLIGGEITQTDEGGCLLKASTYKEVNG